MWAWFIVGLSHYSAARAEVCEDTVIQPDWAVYKNYTHGYQFRFPQHSVTFWFTGEPGKRDGDTLRIAPALLFGNPPYLDFQVVPPQQIASTRALNTWRNIITLLFDAPYYSSLTPDGKFGFEAHSWNSCWTKRWRAIEGSFQIVNETLNQPFISEVPSQYSDTQCDKSFIRLEQSYADPELGFELAFPTNGDVHAEALGNYLPPEEEFNQPSRVTTNVLEFRRNDLKEDTIVMLLKKGTGIKEITDEGRSRLRAQPEQWKEVRTVIDAEGSENEIHESYFRLKPDGPLFIEVSRKGLYLLVMRSKESCLIQSARAIARSLKNAP